jgi:hypothetical protein
MRLVAAIYAGCPQEIIQGGGIRSFQPTDKRACSDGRYKLVCQSFEMSDHMLVMEACKISDGGELNSRTAEKFLDQGGYIANTKGVSFLPEILKSGTSRSPGNAIKFTSCC